MGLMFECSQGVRTTSGDVVRLGAVIVSAGAIGWYLGHKGYLGRCCGGMVVNQSVMKDTPKVVHSCDIEDVGEKKSYCRCWRSKEFPFCDGSHSAHNKKTGDNVGPLIVKGKVA